MTIYLLEIDAHTGAEVETLYVATKTYVTGPDDTPANTIYHGAMLNAGELRRQMFDNGGTIGKPSTNVGQFEISNTDGSRSIWLTYGVGGRNFRLYTLASATADFSTRILVYTGTLRGFASEDLRVSLKLRIRDKLEELNRPFLTDAYGGTTLSSGATADGDATLKNVLKPLAFGRVLRVKPKCVNTFDLIYQVSDSSVSIINVYDQGVQLTSDGNYASLALLQAATITAGRFATCLSLGLFRLASAAAGLITSDCEAQSSTWASNKDLYEPGPLAKRMLLDSGVVFTDIDDDSFDNLKAAASSGDYQCGIYLDDSKSVIDAVSEILASVGAAITATPDNKFKAVMLGNLWALADTLSPPSIPPGNPVDTFTIRDIGQNAEFRLLASPQAEGDGVGTWWINLKYSKYYTTQARSELAGSVNDAKAADLGLDYRVWPEFDATVKDIDPLAATLDFETLLTRLTGVIFEARRRKNFYATRRNFVTIQLSTERADREQVLDIGDEVAIDLDHLGFSDKPFFIIGRHDRFGERQVVFTLWG